MVFCLWRHPLNLLRGCDTESTLSEYRYDSEMANFRKLSDSEIEILYANLEKAHRNQLAIKGVRLPSLRQGDQYTNQALALVGLYSVMGELVLKDELTAFIRQYVDGSPDGQNARHLRRQFGWHILSKNARDSGTEDWPSNSYMLKSIDSAHPLFPFGDELEDDLETTNLITLPDFIVQIQEIKQKYEPSIDHPQNAKCKELLQSLNQRWIDLCGPEFTSDGDNVFQLDGDSSNGVGIFPKVVWSRLTDVSFSKSATRGFYLVLLFSEKAQTCHLSINQGTDGHVGPGLKIALRNNANRMIELIGPDRLAGLTLEINLATTTTRGKNYENGHVCGITYDINHLPTEEVFVSETKRLLSILAHLYQHNTELLNARSNSGQIELMETETDAILKLSAQLNWSIERTQEVIEALRGDKRQIILGGPPGTGKTFAAQKIAEFFAEDEEHIKLVQFHPSYGYEDFVEGLRPVALPNGGFEFKRVPGVIPTMSNLIENDGETRVLIIDEMNRANIARVFGELMFLLEYRDKSIQLMIDNRDFSLPPNLIIIGTMNTVDRSARSLDIAMRRRFRFFQLLPDVEVLKNMYSKPNSVLLNDLGQELYTGFEKLNEKLQNELDRHHTIGHSFFIHKHMTKENLRNIWNQEIFPIIEEYFFDDDKQTAEYSLNAFWPSV